MKPAKSKSAASFTDMFDDVLCDFHDPFGGFEQPPEVKRKLDDVDPSPFKKKLKLGPSGEKPHTYTRSAKSNNHGNEFTPFGALDAGLHYDTKKKEVSREKVITANVGGFLNYLSEFNVRTSNCRVDERERWRGSGLLYEHLRQYSLMRCQQLVAQVKLKEVYFVNDYPCVHLDLTSYMEDVVGDPDSFVEYMCFVFNAYVDLESQKLAYKMPCVCRSSFGFLTPTTAPTVNSIRLNLGLAPTDFLGAVDLAIHAFLKDLKGLKVAAKTDKPGASFFTSTGYSDYRKEKKGTNPFKPSSTLHDFLNEKICSMKKLMTNVTRTFEGGAFATQTCFDALERGENGVLAAVKAPLEDDSRWRIQKGTLSYVPGKTRYAFDAPKPRAGDWPWSSDPDFKKMVSAIFVAATMEVDSTKELTLDSAWAAALFAAEEIYRSGVSAYHKRVGETADDEDGSDSEDEDGENDEKLFHLKLISQGGLNAIGLALAFTKLWIEEVDSRAVEVLDVIPMAYDKKDLGNAVVQSEKPVTEGKSTYQFVKLAPQDPMKPITLKGEAIQPNILFRPPKSRMPQATLVETVKIYMQQMYFESPHLLDINRWLSPVKTLAEAQVILGDNNHCVTSLSAMDTFDISGVSSWAGKRALIVDVTSATMQAMHAFVKKFREELPAEVVLVLVSSGLKNEQLGTDKNAYGTVRFFVKAKQTATLRKCFDALKQQPAYVKQPVVSHSVRRAFKVAGMVPTVSAILLAKPF
ncbi:hypothetical protein ACN469_13140 [Corallococcus terminator]